MKKTAYQVLHSFVYNYVKKNFVELSKKYDISKEDLKELKTNKDNILDWFLGELLTDNEFLLNGITIEPDYDLIPNHTTFIYKIKGKLISNSYESGEYLKNHNYEFVKVIKKKVIVQEYQIIENEFN